MTMLGKYLEEGDGNIDHRGHVLCFTCKPADDNDNAFDELA